MSGGRWGGGAGGGAGGGRVASAVQIGNCGP